MSLYHTYRPDNFNAVVGQPGAVATCRAFVKSGKIPQAMLFIGPSGCGKTTLARIMAGRLKCVGGDLREINASEMRGIDGIREIQDKIGLAPMRSPCRVYIVDECQGLTRDAQSALLKLLEDPPRHVYFFLATTDPQKLLPTIRTRCTEIVVGGVPDKTLKTLLIDVLTKEKKTKNVTDDVADRIVEEARGSARKALVLLEQVIDLKDEAEQMEAINRGDVSTQAIDLCKALIQKKGWPAVAAILKKLDGDAEQARRAVLGYANTVILNSPKGNGLAYLILEAFERNTFDTGKAGLTRAAYEVAFDEG